MLWFQIFRRVSTGVDPSSAMLDVARRKPHGEDVEWVQSSAQTYRSDARYGLIIMTGHAFQVLLTERDVLAVFETMRRHLTCDGLIAFESRNPSIDWSQRWDYSMVLESPSGTVVDSRRYLGMEADRMTFELRYEFPDETLISPSELRFLPRREIEKRLTACGLVIEQVLGDWDYSPFDEALSEEMIFLARRVEQS